MNISLFKTPLKEELNNQYKDFLSSVNLVDEEDADVVALMRDENFRVVACGARSGHILKQFGVSSEIQSGGACASIISELLNDAGREGISRLFLCTKPENKAMFSSLGFYPVIATKDAVLMEDRRNGFEDFLKETKAMAAEIRGVKNGEEEGEANPPVIGAIVMNGNPFTLGHLKLVEYAGENCDLLYLFVVSDRSVKKHGEEKIDFSPEERFEMIVKGTSHIKNCVVRRSDAYLVSRATFPAYFVRNEDKAEEVRTDLDIELFAKRIGPALGISKRFVGEEPFSPITKAYNDRMKVLFPENGLELIEIPRYEEISASKVREYIAEGRFEEVKSLVPKTTFEVIEKKYAHGILQGDNRVSLEEVLAARDRRAEAQREMLKSKKGCCLVSFTLNIPGDVKRTSLTRMLFRRGLKEIDEFFASQESKGLRIIEQRILDEKTGSESLVLIGKKENDGFNETSIGLGEESRLIAESIKNYFEKVEESFPAARLFDFDVLDAEGEKLSRKDPRLCLICGQAAHVCARSRAHGLEVVRQKVQDLLVDFCGDALGEMGREALTMEIHTTPKPGLVDENNNGAHKDMDIPLFERSIEALTPYLKEAAILGIESGIDGSSRFNMPLLRKLGIAAEERMFEATSGVNTHKGIIYSMGLLLFGMGRALATAGDPVEIAGNLAGEDADKRLAEAVKRQRSNGSRVYSNYGAKGAVGEAVSGFPMARHCKEKLCLYSHTTFPGALALIHVMSIMEDTNLLHRGGPEGLGYVQRECLRIVQLIEDNETWETLIKEIEKLDEELIKRNLSPGGSADMLALGYLLKMWDDRIPGLLREERE